MIDLKNILNKAYREYNSFDFIENDPICIPHMFTQKHDIEIMGLFAAVFAWGQRVTIINKCKELINRMDKAPYDFVMNHKQKDLKRLVDFKHRTFNDTDLLYFISFLNHWYHSNNSLEDAFSKATKASDMNIESGLNHFRNQFFSLEEVPHRTRKHIASPIQHSACKRLNMYLRWMVRKDKSGVDFGLWNKIKPHQLVCPLDLHVERVARKLNLLTRTQTDWQAAVELTEALKKFDANDPVKYDFALFGLGIADRM
jgi:uncharacterized protein (TIGR02757 family)